MTPTNSNNNKFITKMTEKRRRRKAMKKANKMNESLICEDEVDYTDSTSRGSDKRVRFGSNSVAVYDEEGSSATTSSIRKDQLWYNKKDLHEQFQKDLAAHVEEQVQRVQAGDYSTSSYSLDLNSSRGLEFHFVHNQRRKDQAEAYVRHIVEKSNSIRKEVGLSVSSNNKRLSSKSNTSSNNMMSKIGRKLDRRMAMIRQSVINHSSTHGDVIEATKFDPVIAEQYADQIQEYCSQYTLMAQELAIGVAASDAAEAKAIYDEEEEEEEKDESESQSIEEQSSAATTEKKTSSSDFAVQHRQPPSQPTKLKQPVSYNAKSA